MLLEFSASIQSVDQYRWVEIIMGGPLHSRAAAMLIHTVVLRDDQMAVGIGIASTFGI